MDEFSQDQCGSQDDRTVSGGEQRPAKSRDAPFPREVPAGEAVDRGKMVGIQSVPQTEHQRESGGYSAATDQGSSPPV